MDKKGLVLGLILLIQACGPLAAQTTDPDRPGLMQRLTDRARSAKENVQWVGEVVAGFADAYYEDHLQPAADRYYQWASSWANSSWSAWDTMKTKISGYMPFRLSQK